MAIDVRLPSINGSTDSQRIMQITRYLYQLAEDLKYNLNTLEAGTSDMTSIWRNGVLDSLDDWKLKIAGAQTSIATIRQKVSSQGASIEMLTEWKSGAESDVSSIAQIKQDVSANGASITSLAAWKSGVEGDVSSIASIAQRVTDAESTIKLLTELNAGDTTSLAELVNRVSASEASITGLTTWKNSVVGSIAKIEQISTADYSSITGLAKFKSDTATNEARIEGKATANGASIALVVEGGKVKGGVLVEAINDESVAKISADRLDIEGKTLNIKVDSTNITGQLKADQIDASNLKVAAANVTGKLTASQIDASNLNVFAANINGTLEAKQIDVDGVLTAGEAKIKTLAAGAITADHIKLLGLEVGNHIKMGAGATISWDSVNGKPTDLATTTDVSNAKTGAVNEVIGLGYQTASQVKTEISESKIRTDQIECTDLNAFGATIGGFTIDNNSLHSNMSSTSNRILLCSGTSAQYVVGGHTSKGWSIIAGSNFGVLKDGTAYMNNAHITGEVTATSGFVGNCRIEDGGIVSANSNFEISPEGDIYANGGIIGGWEISEGIIHSTSGVYGNYSYTTTGTNLIYAPGYAFTLLTPGGICYYIKQSDDFNSKTLAIIYNPIGGNGVFGDGSFTT